MSEHENEVNTSALGEIGLVSSSTGLDARLQEIDFSWNTGEIKADGTFCYLTFKDGVPTQDEFVEYIYHKIVPFCLSRKFIRENLDNLGKTKEERFYFLPIETAKKLFIQAKKKNPKSGEPGEVVLFTLLEGFIKAPRIVSKMSLKTSSNMEVFGSDSIHIKYDDKSQYLDIYWGEAKLYNNLPKALDEIAKSVKKFREYNESLNGTQSEFDIQIIKTHHDIDIQETPEAANALLAYLDPYSANSNKTREIHACLAIWDWEMYNNLTSINPDEIENYFCEKYRERIESACSLFIKNIKEENINGYRFHFLLLPIVSVYEFRKSFCAKVGLNFEEKSGGF